MAIFIPSAKIYEQNNNIVKDNKIDYIEVNSKEIVPANEYREPVYQVKKEGEWIDYSLSSNSLIEYSHDVPANTMNQSYDLAVAMVSFKPTYVENISITFSAVQKNSYIDKVYDLVNSDGEPNIGVSINHDVIKQEGYRTVQLRDSSLSDIENKGDQELYLWTILGGVGKFIETKETISDGVNTIPDDYLTEDKKQIQLSQKASSEYVGLIGASVTAKATDANYTNITSKKINYNEQKDEFSINLTILVGLEIEKLTYTYDSGGVNASRPANTFNVTGVREYYIPKSVEVTIYGDKIGIDLTDKTITLPKDKTVDEVKHPYSFEGNELMQTTNYLLDAETNVKNLAIIKQFTDTLNNYKDGKETATLKLSIGEYYDNKDGTLRISTKKENLPMTFKIGDIVIPYIPSTTIGKDKPMSLYKDGSPKQFRVTRVKPHYSGASWQEIDIQEIAYEAREQ